MFNLYDADFWVCFYNVSEIPMYFYSTGLLSLSLMQSEMNVESCQMCFGCY